MHQTSPRYPETTVIKEPVAIGVKAPLSLEGRQALRTLGNLALKLADGEPLDINRLSSELTGVVDNKPSTTTNVADLLTVTEAHTRLRISKWSLYRLIHERELTTVKVGARRFVPVSEVERFVRDLVTAGGSR
ncbi:helix-turn-helix domain-containing protein [Nocardia sp. NPDC051052]|uniref:helix-turn-helix domain-containing protein n=1 Tax=Nocardia sp. NPDC051052 TaxID=3364322 RepID=UPI0037A1B060